MSPDNSPSSFVKRAVEAKLARDAALKQKEKLAEQSKVLHSSLLAVISPHLPHLPEPPKLKDGESVLPLLMDIDGPLRDMRRITEKIHFLKGEISDEGDTAEVLLEIDGRYELFPNQDIKITVDGLPEVYIVSPEGIVVESLQRELLPGAELEIGGHNPFRPVSSRLGNDEDVELIADFVTRISDPGVVFEHSSHLKRH